MMAESMSLPMMKPLKMRYALRPSASSRSAAEGRIVATMIFFVCARNVSFDHSM